MSLKLRKLKESEEPDGDETDGSEESGEESLELRELKSLMKNEEPVDPQGASLILIFFKVFIIN